MIEIPVWEKYTLFIKEAAAYFRIGKNKLRQLTAKNGVNLLLVSVFKKNIEK